VDLEPNKDGDNTMQVTCADGSTIDVTIAKNLRFPKSEVIDVALSHTSQGSQLMVSTTQIGWWVLVMSDDVVRKARRELDRVSTTRFDPQTKPE
jgi:hypothetical protein